jgi:hypothetical protein
MSFNIHNCDIIVHNINNNYANSSSNPNSNSSNNSNKSSMDVDEKQPELQESNSDNNVNNDNSNKAKQIKRKLPMNSLESFGFKRKTGELSRDNIIELNWATESAEIERNNSNKNNNRSNNTNSSQNNNNDSTEINENKLQFGSVTTNSVKVSVDNNQITIKPAGKRFDWLRFPHLIKIIHETVHKFDFSFRKAADYCNYTHSNVFLDNPIAFSTIQGWYEENPISKATSNTYFNQNLGKTPKFVLKSSIISNLEYQETTFKRPNAGAPRILAQHLFLETKICEMLAFQRNNGTPINSIIAQNLILGILRAYNFPKLVEFGGTFRCSRQWVRKFLQEYCWLTYRRSTNAAQKLPVNAEDQCEWMVQRIAILAQQYSIPPALLVNCDQTGLHYIPKSRYTYNSKGSKDVSVVGEEDKRQFTAVVAVSADNELLPMQLIYPGKPTSARALPETTCRQPLADLGFQFCQTVSHWSTLSTTKLYVETVIQPYFKKKIEELKLDFNTQHCILLVDVWHRDKEFLEYMRTEYPLIKLVFVPGGCTGIAQPCDVFIQRPFKHAVLREFSNWAADSVTQALKQPDADVIQIKLDVTASNLRNIGCTWILNAWNTIKTMKKTMENGWIKCKIMPRAFEQVYQLQSQVKWLEKQYSADQVHVPMGKNRAIPAKTAAEIEISAVKIAEEQVDSHFADGEDELEETEKVAKDCTKDCTNDEAIAETLQAEEDDQY